MPPADVNAVSFRNIDGILGYVWRQGISDVFTIEIDHWQFPVKIVTKPLRSIQITGLPLYDGVATDPKDGVVRKAFVDNLACFEEAVMRCANKSQKP